MSKCKVTWEIKTLARERESHQKQLYTMVGEHKYLGASLHLCLMGREVTEHERIR